MATGGPPEASTNGTTSWFTTNVYPIIEGPLAQCQEYSRSTILESIQWIRWWCHCPPKLVKTKAQTYMKAVADEAAKMTDHVVPTKGAVKNLTDKLLGPDLSDGEAIGRNLTLAALKIVVVTLVVVLISYFVFGVRRMISRYRHTVQLEDYGAFADQTLDPMDLPVYEPRKENDHLNERRATKRIAGPAKTSFVQPPPDTKATGGLIPRPAPVNPPQPQQPESQQALSAEEIVPPPEKLKTVPPPATSSNSFSLSAVTSFFSTKSKPSTTASPAFTTAPGGTTTTSFKSLPSSTSDLSFASSRDSMSTTQVSASTITPSSSMASTASTQAATQKTPPPMVEKPSPDETVSKREKKKQKKKKRSKTKGVDTGEIAVSLHPSPKGRQTSSPVTSLVVAPKRAQSPCRTKMEVPTKAPSIIADPKKLVASPMASGEKLVSFDPKTTKGGSDSANNSTRAPKPASDAAPKTTDAKSTAGDPDITTKSPVGVQECPTQQMTDPTQSPSSSNREVPPTPVSSSENFKKAKSPLPTQTLANENEPPSDQPLVPATPHASFAKRKDAVIDAAKSQNNGSEILNKAAEVLSKEAKTTRSTTLSGSDEPTELKWKGELRSNEQFSESTPGTPPKTPQEMDDKTASRRGAGRDATDTASNQSCDSFSSTVICTCEECNKQLDEEETDEGRMAAGRSASEAEDYLSAQQDRMIQMQERIRQNTTALGILQMYPRGSTAAGCPECQTRRLHPITFRWYDDEPQSVFLTGSFVGWQSKIPMHRLIERRDGNVRSRGFCLELRLPRGHHEYKFIVDKRWAVDEKRQPTIKTREGHMHHVIHV